MCGQSQGASSGKEGEVVQDQVAIMGGNPYYWAIHIQTKHVQVRKWKPLLKTG